MSTGSTIVTDAMGRCGAFGQADTLSDDDAQTVLRALKRLLDSYSNDRQQVWEVFTDTFPTVVGTNSYASTVLTTMGRPVRVDQMSTVLSGVDYPITLIGASEWDDIGYKATRGTPDRCYPQMGYPNATFWLYPTPGAIYTVTVYGHRPLPSTITLATTLAFPPGYERWIVDALAVDIAGTFGKEVTRQMSLNASNAARMLRTVNFQSRMLTTGLQGDELTPLARLYRG